MNHWPRQNLTHPGSRERTSEFISHSLPTENIWPGPDKMVHWGYIMMDLISMCISRIHAPGTCEDWFVHRFWSHAIQSSAAIACLLTVMELDDSKHCLWGTPSQTVNEYDKYGYENEACRSITACTVSENTQSKQCHIYLKKCTYHPCDCSWPTSYFTRTCQVVAIPQ